MVLGDIFRCRLTICDSRGALRLLITLVKEGVRSVMCSIQYFSDRPTMPFDSSALRMGLPFSFAFQGWSVCLCCSFHAVSGSSTGELYVGRGGLFFLSIISRVFQVVNILLTSRPLFMILIRDPWLGMAGGNLRASPSWYLEGGGI